MKKKLSYSILAGMMVGVVWAKPAQVNINPASSVQFNNLDQLQLSLSTVDFNTLVVKGDKITQITCPPTYCQSSINQDGTAQFISTSQGGMPYSVPVYTQDGLIFTIQVKPVSQPGKTYSLEPRSNGSNKLNRWEKSSDYTDLLSDLNEYLGKGEVPKGYSYSVTKKDKPRTFMTLSGSKIQVELVGIYHGNRLNILESKLINPSLSPVKLEESEFYSRRINVRAVILNALTLPAKGNTTLYQVVSS